MNSSLETNVVTLKQENLNSKLTQVDNWDEYLFGYLSDKLDVITNNWFSCFFNETLSTDPALHEQFKYLVDLQLEYMKKNKEVFGNTDWSFQTGGWGNGEINVREGIGNYLNPHANGGSGFGQGMFVDPLVTFIQKYWRQNRSLRKNRCCRSSRRRTGCSPCERTCIGGYLY